MHIGAFQLPLLRIGSDLDRALRLRFLGQIQVVDEDVATKSLRQV